MQRRLLVLGLFIVFFGTGCALSLVPGWEKKKEMFRHESGAIWTIHVASWYEVQWRCGLGFLPFGGVLGCADPGTRTVWAINNPAILWHECNHIKALEGGKSELSEWVADISYGWLLGNMAMAFTLPLGAGENPCGESYKGPAQGRWVRLPTLEEVANGTEVPFAKQNRIAPPGATSGNEISLTTTHD